MRAVSWKEGRVLSIYAGKGVFFLAQMLDAPYLAVFNKYGKSHDWGAEEITRENVLFVKAVTRQFIKQSALAIVKMKPVEGVQIPLRWIASHSGSRFVTLFPGSPNETRLISAEDRPGGKLVEKSLTHPFTTVVVDPEMSLTDNAVIDGYELTTIDLFPNLNERVYLCSLLKRNVDPAKNIKFDREIPVEYLDFVKIYAAKIDDITQYRLD